MRLDDRASNRRFRPPRFDHDAHRRIVRKAIGIVDVLVASEAAEHGLAKQTGQQVTGILAAAALRQHRICEISRSRHPIRDEQGCAWWLCCWSHRHPAPLSVCTGTNRVGCFGYHGGLARLEWGVTLCAAPIRGCRMWTTENRWRYDRSHLRYESDLTDDEWAEIQPKVPPAKRGGNKRTVNVREVLNGPLHALRPALRVAEHPSHELAKSWQPTKAVRRSPRSSNRRTLQSHGNDRLCERKIHSTWGTRSWAIQRHRPSNLRCGNDRPAIRGRRWFRNEITPTQRDQHITTKGMDA